MAVFDVDLMTQLRELQQRHEEFLSILDSKDKEIGQLTELVEQQSRDVQVAKIIDLSKKNRALNLALERERQRANDLAKELANAGSHQSILADPQGVEAVARSMVEEAAEAVDAANKEAAVLRERLNQQTNKTAQLEQRVFTLEAENKKLQRALVREVGDEIPLSKVLDEGSDWKGRRELVINLKEQVKMLKQAQGLQAESKSDQVAKKAIIKASKDKSAELDRLSGELAEAKQDIQTVQRKYEASTARIRILEGQVASLKQKIGVLLEKTSNDDQLITALRSEIGKVRQYSSSQPAPHRVEDVAMLQRKITEQEHQISRQEQFILALQERMISATPTSAPPMAAAMAQCVS